MEIVIPEYDDEELLMTADIETVLVVVSDPDGDELNFIWGNNPVLDDFASKPVTDPPDEDDPSGFYTSRIDIVRDPALHNQELTVTIKATDVDSGLQDEIRLITWTLVVE
jgi:hypothetical protein